MARWWTKRDVALEREIRSADSTTTCAQHGNDQELVVEARSKGAGLCRLDENEYQRLPAISSIRFLELLPEIQEKHHLRCKLHVIDLEESYLGRYFSFYSPCYRV